MITLPMYFLGQYDAPFTWLDFVLFGLHILFLTLETIADNQQFRFQTDKKLPEFADSKRHQLDSIPWLVENIPSSKLFFRNEPVGCSRPFMPWPPWVTFTGARWVLLY